MRMVIDRPTHVIRKLDLMIGRLGTPFRPFLYIGQKQESFRPK
jgi:hypothetical protein